MNSVNIMGRMVIEPEIRLTATQKQCCSFRIAVDAGKDKESYFFPCVAWNATATNIQKFFHKGDKIAITGLLTSRSYEDKEGQKKTTIEILVNSFDFCNGRKEQAEPAEQPAEPQIGTLPFEV